MRNLLERIYFMLCKIPTWEDAIKSIPQGDYIKYDMSKVTIGDMPWKYGWTPIYVEDESPQFRIGREWAKDMTDADNILQSPTKMTLTQPKSAGTKDAWIQSNFRIKYGTVRALIKLPDVSGAHSSFWLFGQNGMPEMDVLEHCGGWENKVSVTHHHGIAYESGQKKMTHNNARYNKNFKPRDEFYLYEVELSPYKVVYKINGVKVRTLKRGLSSGENKVIFNVVKNSYCQTTTESVLNDDAVMIVDFLEVYKIS